MDELEQRIRDLFHSASHELFETGMESCFGNKLLVVIEQHGVDVLKHIESCINEVYPHYEVASEALSMLGYSEDKATYDERLNILCRALTHKSLYIRDGALTGIGHIQDRRCVQPLQDAYDQETCVAQKKYIKQELDWYAGLEYNDWLDFIPEVE